MSEEIKVEQTEVEAKPVVETNGAAAPATKDISELSPEDAEALSAKVAKQGTSDC